MSSDNLAISKLGFGLMRLPKAGDTFDVDQIKAMVDAFLGAGFSYFDTAWSYPGSEEVIRKALVERHPRESYQLATKMAAWRAKTREEAMAQFSTSLERTGAGYFDFYLLHNLGEQRTRFYEDFGVWDHVRELKREGRVRNFGFSFHSTADELDAILTAHPDVDFVQLQIKNLAFFMGDGGGSRPSQLDDPGGVVTFGVPGGAAPGPPPLAAEEARRLRWREPLALLHATPRAELAAWLLASRSFRGISSPGCLALPGERRVAVFHDLLDTRTPTREPWPS